MTHLLRMLGRPSVLCLAVGFLTGALASPRLGVAFAQSSPKVFELRTYTAPDGKLANLHARFRDHTTRIFEKHGMTNVVYLAPTDAPLSQNTLVYLLAHESREAAKKSWAAFVADPEWKKVSAESQVNGPIVSKVESVFLQATDYSPMK
jgi:NIPSNAP